MSLDWIMKMIMNGYAVWPAAAMVVLAAWLTVFREHGGCRIAAGAIFAGGMALLLLINAPVSQFMFTTMILSMGSLYFLYGLEAPPTRMFFMGARILISGLAVATALAETRAAQLPELPAARFRKLYVIGGELSRGHDSYVDQLGKLCDFEVHNISDPEAAMAGALENAPLITSGDIVVLVELWPEKEIDRYAAALASILKILRNNGCAVLMFELPGIGPAGNVRKIQRDAARRYNAVLLPRHLLAGIIYTDGQPSADANRNLAEALVPLLRPLFTPQPLPTPLRHYGSHSAAPAYPEPRQTD